MLVTLPPSLLIMMEKITPGRCDRLTPFGIYWSSTIAPGLYRGSPVLLLGNMRSVSSKQACKYGRVAKAPGVMSS